MLPSAGKRSFPLDESNNNLEGKRARTNEMFQDTQELKIFESLNYILERADLFLAKNASLNHQFDSNFAAEINRYTDDTKKVEYVLTNFNVPLQHYQKYIETNHDAHANFISVLNSIIEICSQEMNTLNYSIISSIGNI